MPTTSKPVELTMVWKVQSDTLAILLAKHLVEPESGTLVVTEEGRAFIQSAK